MRRLLTSFILIVAGIYYVQAFAAHQTESLDQIVAIVNDDVVTRSELNHSMGIIKMQMAQQSTAAPAATQLQKLALNQIINKKIQLQLAQQVGINVSDNDLNRAVKMIADQNGISVANLYQRINSDGMSTTEYRNELRDQITMQKLQSQQEVVGRITISEDEVNEFMHSKLWLSKAVKEYQVEDIVISVPDSASADDFANARRSAQTLLAELRKNPDATLSQAQKNDLGWLKLDELPALFTQQVAGMQAHDFSGPIDAPNGIHLLHLTDVRTAGGSAAQPAPTRKQAEEILYQRKFADAVQTWVSKQRGQAFIQTKIPV